ncbi:hypothetical protein KDL01_27030 [Actinospica durhamensis]|uniref:Immunity protein 21 of polymorphic toxin system n=1 Tax=Actinospica durhamensis TaxID=1508375 RepID=A0A941ETX3_9ACTN|nr:Imm21 family immunity protein [Actinospica durhamensis]MBR7836961.1 hypothetical protein [Actinospica durhamensis]
MNSSPWITSLGGPLILIPESACEHWIGAPRDWPEDEGDYGRACAVDGFIGLIDVGPARALVLGDDPAPTTFHPERNLLIRAIAIEADTDLDALLDRVLPTIDWDEQLTWDIPGPIMLFDSVYSYTQVIEEGEERVRIELAAGHHTVQAGYIQIPDEAWLILVQFTGPEPA